jgi:hypothetical protein
VQADLGGTALGKGHRGRRWLKGGGIAVVVAAVLVLGVGQLVIPSLAEEAVREALRPYGPVGKVKVQATPALTLLWREAEVVEASSPHLTVPVSRLANLSAKAASVGRGRLTVGTLEFRFQRPVAGAVTFHSAALEKVGGLLVAKGWIGPGDVQLQLPGGLRVVGVRASEGLPELVVGANLGPIGFALGGVAAVEEGAVVARPAGFGPLGLLAQVRIYSSPRLYLESLEATESGQEVFVRVTARER